MNAANPTYASAGGVLLDKTQTTVIQCPPGFTGSYTIPGSVADIAAYAFAGCSGLTNVTAPGSVTSIGTYAFADCPALHQAYFLGNAPRVNGGGGSADATVFQGDTGTVYYLCGSTNWGSTFGGLPTAPLGGPCGYTPATCFTCITNNSTIWITGYICADPTVSIPPSINGYPVTCIGTFAFYTNSIVTRVVIPGSVTSIGDDAFRNCPNLASIMIPASVTNIGYLALSFCPSLTSIPVATQNAFYSSVAGVLFDKNETTLLQCPGGFAGTYAVPAGVTRIGEHSFNGTIGLTGVTIGDSVTNIGDSAFYFCPALTNVSIGKGLAELGSLVFGDCTGLMAISVDSQNPFYSSVNGALFNKSQTTIVQYPGGINGAYAIPASVTTVGDGAFWVSGLSSVTFPTSVINLGERAFGDCYQLTSAYFMGNAPSADSTVFQGATGTVYYLPGTTGWGATFGGWPTAEWYQPQPYILGSGYGLGVQSKGFHSHPIAGSVF